MVGWTGGCERLGPPHERVSRESADYDPPRDQVLFAQVNFRSIRRIASRVSISPVSPPFFSCRPGNAITVTGFNLRFSLREKSHSQRVIVDPFLAPVFQDPEVDTSLIGNITVSPDSSLIRFLEGFITVLQLLFSGSVFPESASFAPVK